MIGTKTNSARGIASSILALTLATVLSMIGVVMKHNGTEARDIAQALGRWPFDRKSVTAPINIGITP